MYLNDKDMKNAIVPSITPTTANAVIAWVRSHEHADAFFFDYMLEGNNCHFSFGGHLVIVAYDEISKDFGRIFYAASRCLAGF